MSAENKQGTLVLIPVPIAEGALHTLSPDIIQYTARLQHYFAENVRTARRFIRWLHKELVLDKLQFSEIDKHSGPDIKLLKQWLTEGREVGVLSESGCPGIADPGAELVAVAQTIGATIIPLVGPSSIILSLMGSGLNGQSFCFHGYLPVKEPKRSKRIKELELRSKKENETQIFIETPYRNEQMLGDLIKNCMPGTRICLAQNVTAPDAMIKTRTAADWAKCQMTPAKVPTVFLVLA